MRELGVDVLLLSTGADLPYLTGYEAMPLERLTMLVLPADGRRGARGPALEAPRVVEQPDAFELFAVGRDRRPDRGRGRARRRHRRPTTTRRRSATTPGRASCSTCSRAARRRVPARHRRHRAAAGREGRGRDRRPARRRRGRRRRRRGDARRVPFAGRTELDVHRELVERMLDGGHERANFAIVAAGPNAASPHHDPSDRVIDRGDVVLCDFGGTMHGYCSDITRMFVVGEPTPEVRDAYAVLVEAQEAGVQRRDRRHTRARRSTRPRAG